MSEVDEEVGRLVADPKLDLLVATLAGLRTRRTTLESQAYRYKQRCQVRSLTVKCDCDSVQW